jgi:hypothetical protein
MNSKVLVKWGFCICALVAIFYLPFLNSASAQEVSLTPGSQVDTCDAVDTLWIYFNGAVTGVEAASFTVGYDASYVTPSSVIKSAVLEGNSFVDWTAYPADDSILINVGILTGDFDGPGDFVGIVLTADEEIVSTSITFIRTDLRDALNHSISHTTSSGAAIQIDCTQPVVTCPSDITQDNDAGVCNAVVTFSTPSATDNFTTTPSVVTDPASGSTFPVGTTPVEVIATDDAGNADTCTFNVIVEDNELPTLSCVGNQAKNVDAGECNYTASGVEFDLTASGDNCGITNTTYELSGATTIAATSGTSLAGIDFNTGVTTVTWRVYDAAANTDNCTFTVTVMDNELPTLSCVGNQAKNVDAGECNYTASGVEFDFTASGDNCGITNTTYELSGATTIAATSGTSLAGIDFNTGVTTVTWRVYDAAANTDNCTFTVTVTDNEDPVITCPSNVPAAGCGQTDPSYTGTATATDNCDPDPVITYSDVQVGNVITRTWTATDDATNSDNCNQSITIDDTAAPTMQTIAEAEGGYYNTAPIFSTFGFQDDCDLDSGFYQIDGYGSGSWVFLFGDVSGATWNNNDWALPGFGALAQGTHTVYFRVTDDVDNVNGDGGELSWQFYKDTEPPDAATGFTVEPGHEKCKLSWTNPSGDPSFAGVEIRRNPWCDDAYPEYDDFCSPIGYPASHTQGDSIFKGLATTFKDSSDTVTMPRSVYYYTIFSYDRAGNYSTATTSQQGRATNYWLGDVTGDGEVYFEDLVVLSSTYWTWDGGPNYDPEFDIGPTSSGSPKGIPTTDNWINFEDLVIFAINFAAVSPSLKIAPIFADQDVSGPLALSLVMPPGELEMGKEFEVKVLLRNNPGTVKSIHFVLPYDPSQLEFIRVDRSDGLKGAPCPVFFDGRDTDRQVDVSLALLGGKTTIGGSGEIASITFKLLEKRDLSLSFSLIDLRDGENCKLSAGQEDAGHEAPSQVPSSYGLSQNYPNPYNPHTQIAYQLPQAGMVSLKIYNIKGELVRTLIEEYKPAGYHTVTWDGKNEDGMEVSSGIYFYRMVSGDFSATKKMVMIK